jgi:D-arabinose 1-dehydrogenase-like Zn-dependent alcohol dehydrogenase
MKITAALVPARSAPFEIAELDLAPPLADEVAVRIVASGMCHTDLHARDGYFPNLPIRLSAAMRAPASSRKSAPPSPVSRPATRS